MCPVAPRVAEWLLCLKVSLVCEILILDLLAIYVGYKHFASTFRQHMKNIWSTFVS